MFVRLFSSVAGIILIIALAIPVLHFGGILNVSAADDQHVLDVMSDMKTVQTAPKEDEEPAVDENQDLADAVESVIAEDLNMIDTAAGIENITETEEFGTFFNGKSHPAFE